MTNEQPWHETEGFWKDTESLLFTEQRVEMAVEEIDNLVELLELTPGMKLLDLCCGVGRHSLELARRGYHVTAVDRTERYLERAKAIAKKEGLNIEFICEDMRKFCRPESFGVAINMYTSFGYFEDQQEDRRVATNLYKSLKPSGSLVIEMMSKEVIARIFTERDWHTMDDGTIVLEERKVTPGWSWMENRWILIKDGRRSEQSFSHRPYSAAELSALLLDCGFTSAQAYGGLDASPYDHTAKRMTMVARK